MCEAGKLVTLSVIVNESNWTKYKVTYPSTGNPYNDRDLAKSLAINEHAGFIEDAKNGKSDTDYTDVKVKKVDEGCEDTWIEID